MEIEKILRLMQNAGFIIRDADSQYIYIEEPSCIMRSFATFTEYAWIALVAVTGLLLFGWAISMIRGSKNDIFTNMRNLILIFCIMSAAGPIINVVFGDDLFAHGCKTEQIYIPDLQELLAARDAKLKKQGNNNLYEAIDIYDTGPTITETPVIDEPTPTTDIPTESPTTEPESTPEPGTTPDITHPISAHGDGKNTIYRYPDNSQIRRNSGTPAWRNNNPGNIVASKFISQAGGIGKSGRFGVFPTEQTGMDAIVKLLKTKTYQRKTLANAISAWAPPSDGNNTSKYQQMVSNATGVSLDTPLRNLSDNQLQAIAQIIRQIEGWEPGKETRE